MNGLTSYQPGNQSPDKLITFLAQGKPTHLQGTESSITLVCGWDPGKIFHLPPPVALYSDIALSSGSPVLHLLFGPSQPPPQAQLFSGRRIVLLFPPEWCDTVFGWLMVVCVMGGTGNVNSTNELFRYWVILFRTVSWIIIGYYQKKTVSQILSDSSWTTFISDTGNCYQNPKPKPKIIHFPYRMPPESIGQEVYIPFSCSAFNSHCPDNLRETEVVK
jgi:hypothetical protein